MADKQPCSEFTPLYHQWFMRGLVCDSEWCGRCGWSAEAHAAAAQNRSTP
jgi:hypothetical protein